MSYDYQKERAGLFTEHGVETLTVIRDNAKLLLKAAGAFTAGHAFEKATGSSAWFSGMILQTKRRDL